MIVKAQFLSILSLLVAGTVVGRQQSGDGRSYRFDGHYGQVEVGGRYAGAEFHHSRPLPSRISFYYPVANSIDLSSDYWKRDVSLPIVLGVRIGDAERRWIGKEPWSYTVSPHKVIFERSEVDVRYTVKYEFCLNEPAMVLSLTIKNLAPHVVTMDLYTHLMTSLRTCQTYARKDSALTSFHESLQMIETDFDDRQTDQASVFVENAGAKPVSWTASAEELSPADTGSSTWISSGTLQRQTHSVNKGHPVAAYEYQEEIAPGDSLSIVQIIGSCRRNEVSDIAARLRSSWKQNVFAYDEVVRLQSEEQSHFITGDEWLDHSTIYAKGILASNAHYIDTKIIPMPCPAEYNFFFTHDVLMTDLAAVNFDLLRVKNDLLYVASNSKDQVIPHAYYWRDDGFKTEYCTPDNWNHFWFILLTGSYLRHSALIDSTAERLYPIVTKSLEEVLTQLKSDHLMYAYRPDWWDLGHVEGPRTYTTVLTIRALREYLFISTFLKHRSPKLIEYELLADSMQTALSENLWDEKTGYLTNYNDGIKDEHYYMGSLLAVAYDLLNPGKAKQLLETARTELMAEGIGIRTVMPPDFQTEESISFYKIHGDEAGQPYLYINGGVWPHCNAWYALALIAAGNTGEALKFVRSTMTVDGITHSPMGQPALYEYRYTDPLSKEYGRIDKPSFLWAGGFYLKTLYALYGVKENEWNISFESPILTEKDGVRYSLQFGNLKSVKISANNKFLKSVTIGNEPIPSAVLPLDRGESERNVSVTFGGVASSYLSSVNAILLDASVDVPEKSSTYRIYSFNGHHITATMISSRKITDAKLDGISIKNIQANILSGGITEYKIAFPGSDKPQSLQIISE